MLENFYQPAPPVEEEWVNPLEKFIMPTTAQRQMGAQEALVQALRGGGSMVGADSHAAQAGRVTPVNAGSNLLSGFAGGAKLGSGFAGGGGVPGGTANFVPYDW